eukprot:scaffold91415_cov31-Phaeocystis_antarctica.AAC.1
MTQLYAVLGGHVLGERNGHELGTDLALRPQAQSTSKTRRRRLRPSWLSGGVLQRQLMPQAAPSSGQPRPISRLGRINAGGPHRPCFRHGEQPLL